MEPSYTNNNTSPVVAIAIIVGFALIAGAIYLSGNRDSSSAAITPEAEDTVDPILTDNVPRPVTEDDYILGNPNAPILIIEYSDYECPFCKRFHTVLGQVMEEYGVTGKVAWVYRQFPITNLHPNSAKIAEAALCVGHLGGQEAFWKFTNQVYDGREATDYTNVTKLPEYITNSGVALAAHEDCLQNELMRERLEYGMEDALDAGVEGTPYTFVTIADQQFIINGAESYQTVKGIIGNLVDQLDGEYNIDTATTTADIPTTPGGIPIIE